MPEFARIYADDVQQKSDRLASFRCSTDQSEWPWLALPAQHPIVIQTQNFWTSVGVTQAVGTRDDSKWSALTWTDWELGELDAGTAAHGTFERTGTGDDLAFTTKLFDSADRLIVRISGKGVVFRNRNFEKWREGSKGDARERCAAPSDFQYASRALLGLSDKEPPLMSELSETGGVLSYEALITRENGLVPGHPYFSGSGDHVNAAHLSEIGRQTVSQLNGGAHIHILRGEMDMHRYVELGTAFSVTITEQGDNHAKMAVAQLERSCALITMHWAKA